MLIRLASDDYIHMNKDYIYTRSYLISNALGLRRYLVFLFGLLGNHYVYRMVFIYRRCCSEVLFIIIVIMAQPNNKHDEPKNSEIKRTPYINILCFSLLCRLSKLYTILIVLLSLIHPSTVKSNYSVFSFIFSESIKYNKTKCSSRICLIALKS